MVDPKDLDGQPLELLIKILRMTESDNDNIATTAIRRANAHLLKLGTSWEALLRGKVKIIADPFSSIDIPKPEMRNPNNNQPFRPASPPPPRAPVRPQPQSSPPPHPTAPRAPRSPIQPQPGSPAFAADVCEKTVVNKFAGTCTSCKGRVNTGDGIAKLWKRSNSTTYWTSEHATGTCPPPRRVKPATTADDFQV